MFPPVLCPSNATEVSTLIHTVLELKEIVINTRFAIMDAGYHGQGNIATLYRNKVSFVFGLKGNLKFYRSLTAQYLDDIENNENLVSHVKRHAYKKRVQCKLSPGHGQRHNSSCLLHAPAD
ncbi:MAG: transposase [Deltaproteobacteria bacterium]|nr:transposase [Deltaproteobacteria bacterium]